MTTAEDISRLLVARSLPRTPESALQDAVASVLTDQGLAFRREVRLGASDRIDFLIATLGLEVKVDGSLSDVTRQLHRYAQSALVHALLLVTTCARHCRLPAILCSKPVHHLHLLGGAL